MAGSPTPRRTRTISGTEKILRIAAEDTGKKGLTLGDRFTFTGDLRTAKGRQLADSGGECTLLFGRTEATAQYRCTQVYRFGDSQVFTGGILDAAQKTGAFSILGGTGTYRGATGELRFTKLNADTYGLAFRFDR